MCGLGKTWLFGIMWWWGMTWKLETTPVSVVFVTNGCVLGNRVFVGPNSSVLNDKFPDSTCLTPAIVKDNVVIGGCVTVLPNVMVGEHSVVAAGGVVTKDVPSAAVVMGIPAKVVMTRDEYEMKKERFVKSSCR